MKKLILLVFITLSSTLLNAQVSNEEKNALIDFYNSTKGDQWNVKWDFSKPVTTWKGITVKNNTVVAIELLFNNLSGTLPDTIDQLKNLEKIELSFNKITGSIPASIGNIKTLKIIALNGNMINGTIPESIGNLTYLKQLHLSSNELTGTVPTRLAMLNNLEILNVFDNGLHGTIPQGLSNSKNLKKIIIAENDIIKDKNTATVVLFEKDNENSRFKIPESIANPNKTVIAVETNDDDN